MSQIHLVSADARRLPLADESVQCIVTSPPYWGLRKYAGEQELTWNSPEAPGKGRSGEQCLAHEFDGADGEPPDIRTGLGLEKLSERYRGGGHKQKELCTHRFGPEIISAANDSNRGSMEWTTGGAPGAKVLGERVSQGGFCVRCGTWRGAYGLEPTIELYLAHTIEILRELHRVLRKDGVLFWNIRDSYAGGGNYRGMSSYESLSDKQRTNRGAQGFDQELGATRDKLTGALKAKDLCLIPERVALAAQADGWWVRSRILWCKPNPMPESVRDRPTDAAEHIWMFTKSERYFFDAEAVREPLTSVPDGVIPRAEAWKESKTIETGVPGRLDNRNAPLGSRPKDYFGNPAGRNIRNVWEFATQPYEGAHFATFPEEIPRRCILAATSERGACSRCGAPWRRIIESWTSPHPNRWSSIPTRQFNPDADEYERHGDALGMALNTKTVGWMPGCGCGGIQPDDLEIIETPTGETAGEDPTMELGRAGMARPRGEDEGKRRITRYEQRAYAKQLKDSPHREEMAAGAGRAFEHYTRTDRMGARPVPDELLEDWIARGWLQRVAPPDFSEWPQTAPCVVLDPFGGSGTTGRVAIELNRSAVVVDLAYARSTAEERAAGKDYAALAKERTTEVQRRLPL